jgi:hypothetical protein
MAVLTAATPQDLVSLLELFPVDRLKDHWPKVKGYKEDIAKEIVASEKRFSIVEFVNKYFSCCKQHVYVFSHDKDIKKLPTAGTGAGERVLEAEGKGEGSALFLYWAEFSVVLTDPYEDAKLKFLWPFRFEFTKDSALVRLVVIEKSFSAHFGDRSYIAARKVTDESVLIAAMLKTLDIPLAKSDLHKGIKKLWKDSAIDCVRVVYKDPYATESTSMDEECGIREKKPHLYDALQNVPLLNAKFKIKSQALSGASGFYTTPADGYLAFTRYNEHPTDTDNVVREIIKFNG